MDEWKRELRKWISARKKKLYHWNREKQLAHHAPPQWYPRCVRVSAGCTNQEQVCQPRHWTSNLESENLKFWIIFGVASGSPSGHRFWSILAPKTNIFIDFACITVQIPLQMITIGDQSNMNLEIDVSPFLQNHFRRNFLWVTANMSILSCVKLIPVTYSKICAHLPLTHAWGGRQDMAVILAYVDKPDF
mgnify:CR=1 FL=1